jgi:hypothetical protein
MFVLVTLAILGWFLAIFGLSVVVWAYTMTATPDVLPVATVSRSQYSSAP